MFVVRRSFRNYGQMMLPGSTVEPGSIKWLKTRIKDRYIVEVTAQNFSYWSVYFKEKFGVTIELDSAAVTVAESDTNDAVTIKEEPKTEKKIVVTAVYKD